MRKRLLALVLVGAMAFSVTACKKNQTGETPGDTTGGATQTTDAANPTPTAFDTTPVKKECDVPDYSAYVKLGAYTDLNVEIANGKLSDEEMEQYRVEITNYYNNYVAAPKQVKEGVTAEGDTINFDFKGLLDGVAFEGGTAQGASITIGSHQFIESLESQLAGLEVGKEYELNCTFPDPYAVNPDLSGKDVVFVVTVNFIAQPADPIEYSDVLIAAYSGGQYTSVEEFEADFRAEIEKEALANQDTEYEGSVWQMVLDNSEFISLPEEKLANIKADYKEYYESVLTYYAMMSGTDMETYISSSLGLTMDEFDEELANMAEQEVKYIMVACEIYRALGLDMSDEEFNKLVQEKAANTGYGSGMEFVADYGQEYILESFVIDIVSDYLKNNNNKVIAE